MITTRMGSLTRGRGGLVTVGTVTGLLVAIGATLFGLGAADNAIANYDASSWLASTNKGEVARVNGVTGRVDTRYKVSDSLGHTVQISQTDRYVVLRDLTTGRVSVLDLATLQTAANIQTTAGLGVTVALHGDAAFVIDAVQGVVSQLNPATLTPVGAPLRFPPSLAGGAFDGAGRLWLLVASEGTVVSIQPAPSPGASAGRGGGAAAGDPRIVKTVPIAEPSHDLAMSVLDDGVAVLDKTATSLTTLRGDGLVKVALPLSGPGALPPRTTGADVPVTVVDNGRVYVVTGDKVAEFVVPGNSAKLQPCVAWLAKFYCADDASGTVYVLDLTGRLTSTIALPNHNGALDLEVRENHLFINAPNASVAQVVDDRGRVKLVDKYANNVLGGDPPLVPPPPPPKPPLGPPGAPANVRAAAGNAQARVSWAPAPANGAAIIKYVVEGDGKVRDVGANQRSVDIPDLVNGQQYTFTVYAVNAKGAGPKRAANPVVPTAEVPDPPASIRATENKDGTVAVTWPAANGQGRRVTRYQVTPVSAGAPEQARETDGTNLVFRAGELDYGKQYAFTVMAINERGANSKASPLSNTVVPFAAPGKPGSLRAVSSADKAGTINVDWNPAPNNGRPIQKYVVTAAGKSHDVAGATSTTLTDLRDGATVEVSVRAVNAAGPGEPATKTATTIDKPKVTVSGSTAESASSIRVNFSADLGGASSAASRCTVNVAGRPPQPGACRSIVVGGLLASTPYDFTVTVSNPAGKFESPSRRQNTQNLTGVAVCKNNLGSSDPAQHVWCNSQNNAMEVRNGTSETAPKIGRGTNGRSYTAICKLNGSVIKPYVYNPGKGDTAVWIRINFDGQQGNMSFAWFNVAGQDINSTGPLPNCP